MACRKGDHFSSQNISDQQSGCNSADEVNYVASVSTKNRFDQSSGRGERGEWNVVRKNKRKKVSSSASTTTSFTTLSTDEKLNCMFERLNGNFDMLADIKSDQEKYHQATHDLQVSVANLCDRAEKSERTIANQTYLLKILAYKSVDTEARSRRNNLIIWGVSEKLQMNCNDIVLNFLSDEMGIDTADIVIDRAHRLGTRSGRMHRLGGDPKRPIIVRFRDYASTEIVLRRAYKLKGTGFGIDRDYPKEIANARRELYSSADAVSARRERKNIRIHFPAKLVINGVLIEDKFPDWTETLSENRLSRRHFELPTYEREENNCEQSVYHEDTDVDSDSEDGSVFRQSFADVVSTGINVNKPAHLSDGIDSPVRSRGRRSTSIGKKCRQGGNSPMNRKQSVKDTTRPHSEAHIRGSVNNSSSDISRQRRNTRSRTVSNTRARCAMASINRRGETRVEGCARHSAEKSRDASDTDSVLDTHL